MKKVLKIIGIVTAVIALVLTVVKVITDKMDIVTTCEGRYVTR